MKKLFVFLLLFIFISRVNAQRVYFVYFQSEQDQPFFYKVGEKITSSSSTGYLILSQLKDSTYNFSIGFPGNKWPEQHFSIAINGKDRGYLLKNFGEKGWGLYDLQTLSVQMAKNEPPKAVIKTEKIEVTPFTDVLAKAAGDSTLRERPVAIKEEKKPESPVVTAKIEEPKTVVAEPAVVKTETTPPPAKNEETIKPPADSVAISTTIKKEEPKAAVVKDETKTAEYKRSVVSRKEPVATSEGVAITFIDEQQDGSGRDTIQITIPNPPSMVKETNEPAKEERKFLEITSDTTTKADSPPTVSEIKKPVEEIKKPAEETKKPAEEIKDTIVSKPVVETKPVTHRNVCKDVATDKDFLALRKKMAAETDDDDMVDEARKYFKNKCFTTQQMKNLSALFLDDLGKYKFFDLAYIYVFDIENFFSLQSELKNEYYISRFKAMLK